MYYTTNISHYYFGQYIFMFPKFYSRPWDSTLRHIVVSISHEVPQTSYHYMEKLIFMTIMIHQRLLYTKSGNYSSTFTYMAGKLKALKNAGVEYSSEQKKQQILWMERLEGKF